MKRIKEKIKKEIEIAKKEKLSTKRIFILTAVILLSIFIFLFINGMAVFNSKI